MLIWDAERNGFRVPLNAPEFLGGNLFGLYRILLKKLPHHGHTLTFAIIPKLQARFKKEVYLPLEPNVERRVAAQVSIAPQYQPLKPLPPATVEKDWVYTKDEELLRILFNRISIPLDIEIPRLVWQIRGPESDRYREWQTMVEREIWYDDIFSNELYLDLKFPSWFQGSITLKLQEKPQKVEMRPLSQGKATFDLRAFDDALRNGPTVRVLVASYTAPGIKIHETPLLSIRTRWEADNIECIQTSSRSIINLKVSWNEKGLAGDKEVRLWKYDSHIENSPIISFPTPAGTTTANISGGIEELRPGRYLLQIDEIYPWGSSVPSRPLINSANTKLINIVKPKDLLQNEILRVIQIVDEDKETQPLAYVYHLRIIGRILNRDFITQAAPKCVC